MKNNVLFLVVDCLRSDYVDLNGKKAKGLTPFIKDFSKQGVSFEQAVTQSSWTKTSVASIMTGTYPFTHNVHKILHRIPDGLPTIAEIYKSNGFRTGYFTSNPYLSPGTGYDKGFDVKKIIDKDDGKLLNKAVLDAINQNKNNPFFFYVQYMDTHQPYTVHSKKEKELKEQVMRKFDTGLRSTGKVIISEDEFSILEGLYADEVRYTDGNLKQLIGDLKSGNILNETIVVITADHGIELMEHGGLYHSAKLYNEMISVPLVLVGPGIKKGKFIKGRVRSIDLIPTLLDYSELDPPESLQGISLKNYMEDEDRDFCNLQVYSERDRSHEHLKLRALLKGSWKLISYEKEKSKISANLFVVLSYLFKGDFAMVRDSLRAGKNYLKRKIKGFFQSRNEKIQKDSYELFDLSIDPKEKTNLSIDNNKILEEMKRSMEDFLISREKFSSEENIEMDKGVEKRLKDLGYLD